MRLDCRAVAKLPPFAVMAARGLFGVYVHIPFCQHVCPYCDFAVEKADPLAVEQEDRYVAALERELRADEKECAEHVMLVDLGRNDLGRVCRPGTIALERVLDVERYSHVMHLSSTVTGQLREDLDCWDALRNTLPVGTVSGAPKIRAMQIIDELEPTHRGPYAGGIGYVCFGGDMDMALALRTMVVPTDTQGGDDWMIHLQAGAGIVADSVASREYDETVNKAAALGRAIDLAESLGGWVARPTER